MEIALIVFAALILILWAGMANHSGKLKALKEELKQFKDETYRKQIDSQIREYLKLKGYAQDYEVIGGYIYHRSSIWPSRLCGLYELEDKLAALKKDLERNCPKKCRKAKK